MQKLCLLGYQSGLSCTAEHLLKVQILTLIRQIDHTIRMIFPDALHDRCKICRVVKRGSV